MNRLLFAIIIFPIMGLCQPTEELRKSIYFDGGSYYIDSAQVAELTHWLDSIPHVAEGFEIELISHTDPIGEGGIMNGYHLCEANRWRKFFSLEKSLKALFTERIGAWKMRFTVTTATLEDE